MDSIDRKIIVKLQEDGRASYKKLGETVNFTIMGVKRRIQKMLTQNLIRVSAEINVEALNLYAALVLLELENREMLDKILERFKECPRIVKIFIMLAGYNLAILMIAEDRDTLESESLEKCSLRSCEGVRRSEFYPIGSIQYSPFLNIREKLVTKDRKITPCNIDCGSCKRYQDQKCVGCPSTTYYRGPL
ncbi:AsnC family transcriptional regulator [Candidatus Bathyarchaeota archaeon]|nr:AsnC family transcriptional regulator [Candidatus Bathyarchaeota archaeon]